MKRFKTKAFVLPKNEKRNNMWKPIKDKDIMTMSKAEFEVLPHRRRFDEDIGQFDSLIILPSKSHDEYESNEELAHNAANRLLEKTSEHIHDSGFRLITLIAAKSDHPICILSECSDIIHIEGIGGLGDRHHLVRDKTYPQWTVDCLPKSGLLRLFCQCKSIEASPAASSFDVISVRRREDKRK